jgi:hypothetical protein
MQSRLFTRKQCWVPTARGWMVLVLLLLGAAGLGACSIHGFLCVNRPLAAEVLVVESWLPDSAMRGAIQEFNRGGYKYVVTSGGPMPAPWLQLQFKTGGEFAAANLAALGLDPKVIVATAEPEHSRDRTYASALAIKEWLRGANITIKAVNVYSIGAHARRSRLLFQKALGGEVMVGIISHPDSQFDPKYWWASMGGFSGVMNEGLAYLYARFLFHPPREQDAG